MTKAIRWTPERYAEHQARRTAQALAAADRIATRGASADNALADGHRWSDDDLAAMNAKVAPQLQFNRIAAVPAAAPKPAKYHNKKVEADGIVHDSRKESRRWAELQRQAAAGEITDLQRQVKFELIPAQRRADGKAERACAYVADFVYLRAGQRVVADAKGMKTKDYIIKRKLMLFVHNITVMEI